MDKYSFLGSLHISFYEKLYSQYLDNPDSLDSSWRSFFQGYEFANEPYGLLNQDMPEEITKEFQVISLIDDYRKRGHLFTQTNPVRDRRDYNPKLNLENYNLSSEDLDLVFQAGNEVGLGPTTLKEILIHLQTVYCQSIGIEYVYIRELDEFNWIKNFIHKNNNQPNFDKDQKIEILKQLNSCVGFEKFLHKKYVGQKRFSIEGAESIIPSLEYAISQGAQLGVNEFIFGMAHRGRLSVLANIFNKSFTRIFNEFEGVVYEDDEFDGDVKYHLGYNCKKQLLNGKTVEISLAPNPSHLEAVGPIVQGISRSKIDKKYQGDNSKLLPILIHGDAAIAGQGVVYEIIQMSQLNGYKTGGTIHIVINNQVGFTTNYLDGRSSTYCTDVAKTILSPVLHVNGDDVEAVMHTIEFAIKYRQKFKKDVFIDLLCYRKYGHNEGDEPKFTQPKLYKLIERHLNPKEIYLEKLLLENIVNRDQVEKIENAFSKILENEFTKAKQKSKTTIRSIVRDNWQGLNKAMPKDFLQDVDTKFNKDELLKLGRKIYTLPDNHNFYKKTKKLFSDRLKMLNEGKGLDWGMAELLAYSTLLSEGIPVRISGQDVERGTFSHRHAIIKSENSETKINIFESLHTNEVDFTIYNSFLSEYAVLGFEYGYAAAKPHALTIWEAQFGDFCNGAQIIIDQYISSAEEKWNLQNGLVLYLPHGYEGQGAEHSSARMERFLQLCAQNNMQILNCTTPANLFHMLRRQMKRSFRKPLILFSPKSLLRHPKCISSLSEFTSGTFKEVIDDEKVEKNNISTLVFTSGKLYYELDTKRDSLNDNKTAIIRIEQLYPFPNRNLETIIQGYKNVNRYIWVQEEPKNMGPWFHVSDHFRSVKLKIELISRDVSASPASGSSQRYNERQNKIINKVFNK
ncbi:MAG: 2-oxoglutarate dehydrogenase E1 component [Flavobacteriales bacterium TMED191]|nr:MAG: 2-oxoglutarate dehydrogenase E1 component [Flavobacteriales bacterium TMED191]|tara:strand:- start:2578 stop:5301 length:2724 start_codon:yes stop_codon:yes gene_type:complete